LFIEVGIIIDDDKQEIKELIDAFITKGKLKQFGF